LNGIQNKLKFMNIDEDKEGDTVVEAIISLWKINKNGHLVKRIQKSFSYDQIFQESREGRMMLSLSYCRTRVSLGLVDPNKEN
jgi:hypothetical protein